MTEDERLELLLQYLKFEEEIVKKELQKKGVFTEYLNSLKEGK